MTEKKKYRAFISYSQRDKIWARRIQSALENYRLPKELRIDPNSRSLGRFFRDDDEMGAATDLGATLRGAISEAENLIVVASPSSASSKWVNEEVLHFKRTGRSDRIFAVIVGGMPNSGNPATECYPPALRFALNEEGELSDQPAEPLGIDVRKESLARLRAKLTSGLLGIPFDSIWRRDKRRRYARGLQVAAVAILVAGSVGGGVHWFNLRESIRRIEEPAIAAYNAGRAAEEKAKAAFQLAMEAAGKVPRASDGTPDYNESLVEGDIMYVAEGYAGGVTYMGSRSSVDRRWFHVYINWSLAGHQYGGEVPYSDKGEFVGQGGDVETKFGNYLYAPNCVYLETCNLEDEAASRDRDAYLGSIIDFMPDGPGVYWFSNNDMYSGQFSRDAIDGFGVFRREDGTEWVGQWERNRSVEPGFVRSPDGSIDFASYAGLELAKRHPPETGE